MIRRIKKNNKQIFDSIDDQYKVPDASNFATEKEYKEKAEALQKQWEAAIQKAVMDCTKQWLSNNPNFIK